MIDPEIWRIAAGVVREHGAEAGTLARRRIAAARDADTATLKTWLTVVAAIDEIQRIRPAEGERLN
jgi:hypothetical protein